MQCMAVFILGHAFLSLALPAYEELYALVGLFKNTVNNADVEVKVFV
jgi:hypothetical protein